MLRKFGTQDCNIDDKEGYVYTTLEEPWYRAGVILGWSGNPSGIGIAKEIVEFAAARWYSIAVSVGTNSRWFIFDAEKWKNLCEENNWIYKLHEGKTLYVLPWSIMRGV